MVKYLKWFPLLLFNYIFTEDEEREQLAKELSKDWSAGKQIIILLLSTIIYIYFLNSKLYFYSFWAKHKYIVLDWNGQGFDAYT